jgi:prepilin-type N-terminal cleavage/methylation domain-containing protein
MEFVPVFGVLGDPPMKKLRAFTLIELLVVIAIIALLIGILVPALGAARKQANKMKNGTQLKAIMTAYSMWSDANTTTSDLPGGITTASGNYPVNAVDTTVVGRFWALIAASGIDPLNPKMMINPISSGTDTLWTSTITINPGVTTATTGVFSYTNVSYALLSTTMGSEWKNNVNAGCPMVCDRGDRATGKANTDITSPTGAASTWSNPWTGSTGWGDVHATFENSSSTNITIYGNSFSAGTSVNFWLSANSSNAHMVTPGSGL